MIATQVLRHAKWGVGWHIHMRVQKGCGPTPFCSQDGTHKVLILMQVLLPGSLIKTWEDKSGAGTEDAVPVPIHNTVNSEINLHSLRRSRGAAETCICNVE